MCSSFCLLLLLCIVLNSGVNSVSINNSEPLIVTPLLNQGLHKEARQQARVNLTSFDNRSYSGYFQVEAESESNLFFWFFPSQDSPRNNSIILCLNGGPGESSLLMLFLENGPMSMNIEGNLTTREHSWTKTNSILYIDSPVTVGFSVSNNRNVSNLPKVTRHLLEAVKQFYQMFPYLVQNDFYIMGESYGGKYAPSLANAIHAYNQNAAKVINLKGVVIANGLTDPKHQTGYADFLYTLGMINIDTKNTIEELERTRSNNIDSGNWTAVGEAFLKILNVFSSKTGFENLYHILEPADVSSNYTETLDKYLNQDNVQEALHVGTNNYTAYHYLPLTDMFHPVPEMVEMLLNEDYKVLIYTGQLDFIIAYITVVNYLKTLSFPGSSDYLTAEKHIWRVNGTVAGYVTEAGNLYDVLVRNAGHMAGMHQGKWVYDLVDRFVNNRNMWD